MNNDPGSEAERMEEWEEAFEFDREISRQENSDQATKARARYALAKASKTGQTIPCGFCARPFTKTSYQQAFCCNKGRQNCKDSYWNRVNPRGLGPR